MTTLTASALDVGVGAGWEALDAANDCVHPLDEVDWNDAGLVVSLVVLGLINVLVIVGNILVVLAVFLDARLRTGGFRKNSSKIIEKIGFFSILFKTNFL